MLVMKKAPVKCRPVCEFFSPGFEHLLAESTLGTAKSLALCSACTQVLEILSRRRTGVNGVSKSPSLSEEYRPRGEV